MINENFHNKFDYTIAKSCLLYLMFWLIFTSTLPVKEGFESSLLSVPVVILLALLHKKRIFNKLNFEKNIINWR